MSNRYTDQDFDAIIDHQLDIFERRCKLIEERNKKAIQLAEEEAKRRKKCWWKTLFIMMISVLIVGISSSALELSNMTEMIYGIVVGAVVMQICINRYDLH